MNKECTKCHKVKPIEEFGVLKDYKYNREYVRSYCKKCNARGFRLGDLRKQKQSFTKNVEAHFNKILSASTFTDLDKANIRSMFNAAKDTAS